MIKNYILNFGILSPSETYCASFIRLLEFLPEAKINHIQSIRKRIPEIGEFLYSFTIDCVCYLLTLFLHV